MGVDSGTPLSDTGLRCLQCQYNLTGLSGTTCPECGANLDWQGIRNDRDRRRAEEDARRQWRQGLHWVSAPGTPWDSWRWYLKPIAFVVTLVQVALLPHRFARSMPVRPRLGWAIAFAIICGVALPRPHSTGTVEHSLWIVGVVVCTLMLAGALWMSAQVGTFNRPWGFWLAICCYTSYPLLLGNLGGAPPAALMWGSAPVWPVSFWMHGKTNVLSTVLFYLWWLDLVVIWAIAAELRRRVHMLIPLMLVPVITFAVPWIVGWLAISLA